MGPPAAPCWGSLTPAVLLFLLLLFLLPKGPTEGCLHCGHQFKNLKMRFAHLCARYQEHFGRRGCSKYPWGAKAVREFALDEEALDLLLEKAHRVLRVMAKFRGSPEVLELAARGEDAKRDARSSVSARLSCGGLSLQLFYLSQGGDPLLGHEDLLSRVPGVAKDHPAVSLHFRILLLSRTGLLRRGVSFPSWSWKKIEDGEKIRNLFYVLGRARTQLAP